MLKSSEIRTGRHCVFQLHVHLVFVTKYRRRVFTKVILEDMKEIFEKVCGDFESRLVEFDGEENHVHLLVNFSPKISISRMVNSLKGVSSRRLRQKHPSLESHYWQGVLWSPSYFASSCGGAPISIIRQYIENQQTPE